MEKKIRGVELHLPSNAVGQYGAQINFGGRRDPHNSNGPPANCVNWAWKDEGLLISLFKRFVFYFFGEMVMSVIYNGSGDESDATLIFLGVK